MYMLLLDTLVASSLCIREDAFPPPFSPPLTSLCLSYKDFMSLPFTFAVSHSSSNSRYFFLVSINVASFSSPKARASSASFSGMMRAIVLALTIQLAILACHSMFLASRASAYLGFSVLTCFVSGFVSPGCRVLSLIDFSSFSRFISCMDSCKDSNNFLVHIFFVASNNCVFFIMV